MEAESGRGDRRGLETRRVGLGRRLFIALGPVPEESEDHSTLTAREPIAVEMEWGEWMELHPNTDVVSAGTGYSRPYSRYPYRA